MNAATTIPTPSAAEVSAVVVDPKERELPETEAERLGQDEGPRHGPSEAKGLLLEKTGGGIGGQSEIPEEQEEEKEEQREESETLRILHASVVDPYDPHVPNDYLAYRERKKADRVREEMEREAVKQLEIQRRMRERIEEERRKADESGDLDRIVESRVGRGMGVGVGEGMLHGGVGRGRGRGRGGVQNLPAWLVKRQQEEREKASATSTSGELSRVAVPGEGQFNDAGEERTLLEEFGPNFFGRLVVLGNMVPPGRVDHDLPAEVKEECVEACGPVVSVRVRDAALPRNPEVRVFVLFEREDHAARASSLFHGRNFGDRRITARLATKADVVE